MCMTGLTWRTIHILCRLVWIVNHWGIGAGGSVSIRRSLRKESLILQHCRLRASVILGRRKVWKSFVFGIFLKKADFLKYRLSIACVKFRSASLLCPIW